MIRFVLSTLMLVLTLDVSSALAQGPDMDTRARMHFDAGTDYFDRGDYENALRELQIAHEMSQRPELLYNLGACYERLGRLSEAADQFDAYLAALPDAANAAVVRERSARLRERAASAETVPEETPLEVATPEEDITPEAPPAPGPSTSPHPAGFVVLGAGALSLVALGVLGGLALAEDASLASSCGTSCPPERVASLDSYALGADISLGIGAALAVAGTIMLFTVTETSGPSATARLGIGPTGVSVTGAF